MFATTCLAASLGSAMSTFGVEVCEEGNGPCGINSSRRLAKIVFELIFSLIFGIPPLVAALAALLLSAERQVRKKESTWCALAGASKLESDD